jgi:SAM-dependent methyltransferase
MMKDALLPWDLRAAFERGENLMALLRQSAGGEVNSERAIELSYDLQSGAYIEALGREPYFQRKLVYTRCLGEVMTELGGGRSLLDAGMGEGTTLWGLLSQMQEPPAVVHGFDLCWSRLGVGRRWLREKLPELEVQMCTASLLELPYADNSFDLVYTAHAVEPNRGREAAIMQELMRVCGGHLVMLEPAYELADEAARERMDRLGYCRGLADRARELGFEVLRHELFAGNWNAKNPTALLVLRKPGAVALEQPELVCPAFRTPLRRLQDCFYSDQSMRAYPVIGGIPCLRSSQGVVASQLGPLAGG